eukprot:Plantae.Rhodophyta-Hildenbrandia_rubra.ctg17858.p2 GENE.Plantae.Rhodophyta-Hildenbrandia_rubra.ctg17858~~Plantae.Rhodophyta-Hildenbrandia_rubra.ctg17858.p2  ORF type:complete len:173 (-),score=39.38 Plantae.Rhodophyta-Hildenbrandia_rubra.ctg17858:975-1493(-)
MAARIKMSKEARRILSLAEKVAAESGAKAGAREGAQAAKRQAKDEKPSEILTGAASIALGGSVAQVVGNRTKKDDTLSEYSQNTRHLATIEDQVKVLYIQEVGLLEENRDLRRQLHECKEQRSQGSRKKKHGESVDCQASLTGFKKASKRSTKEPKGKKGKAEGKGRAQNSH